MGILRQGPCNLARAILFDRLNVDVSEGVAIAFTADVIRELPKGDIELPSSVVDAWVAAHPEVYGDVPD
jgi:hypothetical protein